MKSKLTILFLVLLFPCLLWAQTKTGTIKVRKSKVVKGLYVLDEGAYYKTKLYVRFFDNNAAVFLRAAISPTTAKDSTAKLLYTYRKNPSVYKIVNDSVFIEGMENKIPFIYRGISKGDRLKFQKISASQKSKLEFKKVL